MIEGFKEIGILRQRAKPSFTQVVNKKYAYVIYDLDHERSVRIIRDFLRSIGIDSMGRFGEWEYFNTDHAFLSGMRAAEFALKEGGDAPSVH